MPDVFIPVLFLKGCEKRAQKVIDASDESHLQPFKDNMLSFLEKGSECLFSIFTQSIKARTLLPSLHNSYVPSK